jgi:hypothetical protein
MKARAGYPAPQKLVVPSFAIPPRKKVWVFLKPIFPNRDLAGAPSTLQLHFLYMRFSRGPNASLSLA